MIIKENFTLIPELKYFETASSLVLYFNQDNWYPNSLKISDYDIVEFLSLHIAPKNSKNSKSITDSSTIHALLMEDCNICEPIEIYMFKDYAVLLYNSKSVTKSSGYIKIRALTAIMVVMRLGKKLNDINLYVDKSLL